MSVSIIEDAPERISPAVGIRKSDKYIVSNGFAVKWNIVFHKITIFVLGS